MGNPAHRQTNRLKKSVTVVYLLWLFLGGFGSHRFYSRQPLGWLYILLFLFGVSTARWGVGFLFLLILAVWWVIDGFLAYQWIENYNAKLVSSLEKQRLVGQDRPPKVASKYTHHD